MLAVVPRYIPNVEEQPFLSARSHIVLKRMEVGKALSVEMDEFSVQPNATSRESTDRRGDRGETVAPFSTTPCDKPDIASVLPAKQSPPVVLDFMEPGVSSRHFSGE